MSADDMKELEAMWTTLRIENKDLRQDLAALLGSTSYIVVDPGSEEDGDGTDAPHPTTRLQSLVDAIQREKAERRALEILLHKNQTRLAELYAFNAKLREELRAIQGQPLPSS
jgi:hypothetical protein